MNHAAPPQIQPSSLISGKFFQCGPRRYTEALLVCDPARLSQASRTLPTIGGEVPDLIRLPSGCIFAPRCPKAFARCRSEAPQTHVVAPEHTASCHLVPS